MKRSLSVVVATALAIIWAGLLAVAQDKSVVPTTWVQYPSLTPVSGLQLTIKDVTTNIGVALHDVLGPGSTWDCRQPNLYKVTDGSGKSKRTLDVRSVYLPGLGTDGKPLTDCTKVTQHIDLILGSQVDSGDQLQVSVYRDTSQKSQPIFTSSNVAFTTTSFPAFTATPQAAPGEALNNGTKRDVGQLAVSFSNQNLIGRSPVNVYVRSNDLFSTDENDAKSAFSGTLGFQRGLFPTWYSPLAVEETIQGNQVATNLSAVTDFTFNTLPSWHWTKEVLANRAVYAPLPFEPALSFQYTRRIQQLVTKKSPALSVDDISLNPTLSWSSISFPWVCGVLSSIKFIKMTTNMQQVGKDINNGLPPPVCLRTELDLGAWYLPLDVTQANNQRFEGYGDISILIPLSDMAFASNILTYATKGQNSAKFQVRIKYSDSVNSANNYARTKQWSFGIEASK